MTKRLVGMFGTLALALFALGSARAEDKAATLSGGDKSFMMEAAEGGQTEVELGQLAKDKGQSDAVKQFGQHMVDDHGKANSELSDLAGRKGVTVSTTLSTKHKDIKDKLSKLSGAEFDKQYMREMVKDHEADVAAFKKEANKGKDADVTAWAKQTLPTLEQHLTMAREANAQVNGKAAGK
jgi:putative membrane protein